MIELILIISLFQILWYDAARVPTTPRDSDRHSEDSTKHGKEIVAWQKAL
jgi:hypothetical protein